MIRSIGALEFRSISKGIEIGDQIVKKANVEIIYFRTLCPGRFLIIVTGDEGAVDEAIGYGEAQSEKSLIDSFRLHAVTPAIIEGFKNKYEMKKVSDAIGIIETNKVCTGIEVLDHMLKASDVKLIKLQLALCIGGKLVFTVTGAVSSIEYGFQEVKNKLSASEYANRALIPSPSEEIKKYLV
ncbi:ethanolamine utilization protein [Sporanaerobium hydrogeniformans]|uniref:Ethanolamine utilization protein n=1 Tax=Sporanaerobium hydrogeniformans TaxID=3072179 RepID=A0AC61DBI5_9FIRM|nr:BMC domain-containing protein [Sporanaerobium hydrogeniformans]PHV70295.1 ethanolamine utilization protein [Sporanaerobium hydrogeniformans]